MPINTDSLNCKLYDLLKVRGYAPVPKDAKGQTTPVPDKSDIFKFTFKSNGDPISTSWATIDSNRTLTLYYDDEATESVTEDEDSGHQDDWTKFIKTLKAWALRKQLGFKLVNKDHLQSDMARRAYMKENEQITESYYPINKSVSYNDAIPTVKIILQHTRQIGEGEQRFRNIAKIFLENLEGERILAPTTRPGIAQVYARHLAEGGLPHDDRWKHIGSLVEEYAKMAGFVRATRNGQFNESTQRLVAEGANHYQSLREALGKMRGHRGYNTYFEAWTPALNEEVGEENNLSDIFVQETLDPRIESVMPILAKLQKRISEMTETKELEAWANNIIDEATDPLSIPEGSDNTYMGKYVRNGKSFTLWSRGNYEYELTTSVQPFKKVRRWPDSAIEEVKKDLEGLGFEQKNQGIEEDLGPEQKRVGQLGPTEKITKKNPVRGKLVGACESKGMQVAEQLGKKWIVSYWVEPKSYDDRPSNEYEDWRVVTADTPAEALQQVKSRHTLGQHRYDFQVRPAKESDLDLDEAEIPQDQRGPKPSDIPAYMRKRAGKDFPADLEKEKERYISSPEWLRKSKEGVTEDGMNEIDHADALDSSNISPNTLMQSGKVIGNIEGNDIVMLSKGNQTVYILKVNDQATALVGFEGKNLKNIKNFTQAPGVIRALIGYLVHKKNMKIVVSPNEPLTSDGLKWIIKLIKDPRGLVIKDRVGKDIDPMQLNQEWQTAKKTGTPGTTGITIAENIQFGNKIRENESRRNTDSLLMPFNFYSVRTEKQGVAEGIDPTKEVYLKVNAINTGMPKGWHRVRRIELDNERDQYYVETKPGYGIYCGVNNSKTYSLRNGQGMPITVRQANDILNVQQGVAEGAPELLKQEMPLVRHIEQELAKHGYEKGTEEYNTMFKHQMSMYRKFGNVDAIKKGVAEGLEDKTATIYDNGYVKIDGKMYKAKRMNHESGMGIAIQTPDRFYFSPIENEYEMPSVTIHRALRLGGLKPTFNEGVAEGSMNEIGYSDKLGNLNVPDSKIIASAIQDGTISQKPVMKYEQGNATLFFFTDDDKISALVLVTDGNKLRAIKNFSEQSGQIYALINYIVNISNLRLVVTPDEPLTKEGFQWLAKLIKNPSGLKVSTLDGTPVDVKALHNEWLKSKSIQGTESGETGITISESSQKWKNKLQENETSLMPHHYFNLTGKIKSGVAEEVDTGGDAARELRKKKNDEVLRQHRKRLNALKKQRARPDTDKKEQGVAEGWGAEAANKKHQEILAKYKALYDKYKDDLVMTSILKKLADNNLHPDYAEKEAKEKAEQMTKDNKVNEDLTRIKQLASK